MNCESISTINVVNTVENKERYLYLFGQDPGLLTGTLSLGLFCHSVILPLMKTNRNQENNTRDLFLGYVCVSLTYIIIGIFSNFILSDFY